MKVLVTGASGMYGGGIARALVDRGDEVTVLQRRPARVEGAHEILGDITEPGIVARAVAGVEGVVHLAARVAITGAWELFERTNVVGTRNVVTAATDAGVRRLVFVSSPSVAHQGAALVGAAAEPPDPGRARGSYARSKAMAEMIAREADRGANGGLATVAIRPHLVWGPGDTQLIGRIVDRARDGRLALVDRGAALIDTTYVTNAVDATVAALDRAPQVHGRAFVVSNGEPRTVREILTRVCRAAGLPAPRLQLPFAVARTGGAGVETLWRWLGRDDDPPMTAFLAEQLATAHWFDQRETRQALHWRPRVTLAEGFERLASAFASVGVGATGETADGAGDTARRGTEQRSVPPDAH